MTSPNPMALEARALELDRLGKAMGRLLADSDAAYKRWLADAERAAALPLPAAGEGPTPQAQVMALIQEALALAPDAGLYLKIEVGAAK